MHGLLGGLPHARYKAAYQGRESDYASGHRHLLHQPLYRKDGGDGLRGLLGALPYPSRAYGSLRGHAYHPTSKPGSLHRLWRLRIDLSRTPDESDHHQGKRGTQVRGEAQRGRGEKVEIDDFGF